MDQRNHGQSSRGFRGPHTLAASAHDLHVLLRERLGSGTPAALLGHSLGGKVVLEYLRQAIRRGGTAAGIPGQVKRVPPSGQSLQRTPSPSYFPLPHMATVLQQTVVALAYVLMYE